MGERAKVQIMGETNDYAVNLPCSSFNHVAVEEGERE